MGAQYLNEGKCALSLHWIPCGPRKVRRALIVVNGTGYERARGTANAGAPIVMYSKYSIIQLSL